MVRFQVALSAGELDAGSRLNLLYVVAQVNASDRWARQAVMSSLKGNDPSVLLTLFNLLPDYLDKPPGRVWLDELGTLIGATNDPKAVRSMVSLLADTDTRSGTSRLNGALPGLGAVSGSAGGSLGEVLEGPGTEALAPLFEQAARTAGVDGPADGRIDAIRLLGLGPRGKRPEGAARPARRPPPGGRATRRATSSGRAFRRPGRAGDPGPLEGPQPRTASGKRSRRCSPVPIE